MNNFIVFLNINFTLAQTKFLKYKTNIELCNQYDILFSYPFLILFL